MSGASDSEAALARRRADLWTSLVLLVIAAAMIGGALQFPLEGDYAGVRNAWYVSPALFPLIVAAAIASLAVALLLTAIRAGAASRTGTGSAIAGMGGGGHDVLLIGGLITAFVAALVPRVDFILAAAFFLFAFTTAFHTGRKDLARVVLGGFALAALGVLVVAALGMTPQSRSMAAFLVDGLILLLLALVMAVVWWRADGHSRQAVRQCIGVALATPLILAVVFKIFLLVPLPREGLIVVALDTLRYAVREAL